MNEPEASLKDILNEMKRLTHAVSVLKDCYVALHNQIMTRQIPSDDVYVNRLQTIYKNIKEDSDSYIKNLKSATCDLKIFDYVAAVKKLDEMVHVIRVEHQQCYKWIAKHIYAIEEKLPKIIEQERQSELSEDNKNQFTLYAKDVYEIIDEERPRRALQHRFGKNGNDNLSYKEIGILMNLSSTRVREHCMRGFRWLKNYHQAGKIDIKKLKPCLLREELLYNFPM